MRIAWVALFAVGCAHAPSPAPSPPTAQSPSAPAPSAPTAQAPSAPAPSAPTAQAPSAPAPTFKERMETVGRLLHEGRDDEAERELFAARAGLSGPPPAAITWGEATVALDRGDFARAQKLFEAHAAAETAAHHQRNAAWAHNALTWVRWGAGDGAGALAENEAVATIITRADVGPEVKRGVLLHYWWDKAYLLAEQHHDRQADQARAEYQRLARQPDEHDGLAVLAAWFAVVRGDGKAARAAAVTVDVTKDDDLQDLYVIARALDAGGDAAGAAAVRARIRDGAAYPMKPLILRQMAKEAAADGAATRGR
jgi:hypothetical protein